MCMAGAKKCCVAAACWLRGFGPLSGDCSRTGYGARNGATTQQRVRHTYAVPDRSDLVANRSACTVVRTFCEGCCDGHSDTHTCCTNPLVTRFQCVHRTPLSQAGEWHGDRREAPSCSQTSSGCHTPSAGVPASAYRPCWVVGMPTHTFSRT